MYCQWMMLDPVLLKRGDANASLRQRRGEKAMCPIGDMGACFSNAMQPYVRPPNFAKTDNARPTLDVRDIHVSPSQLSSSMTSGGGSRSPNFVRPFSSGLANGKR